MTESTGTNETDVSGFPLRSNPETTASGVKPRRSIFTPGEITGSLGDLGTLLPIVIGLVAINGINATTALILLGVTYVLTGLYYRVPVPVQPLKAVGMIAIATGAAVGEIRATAFLIGMFVLALGVAGLADRLDRVFPRYLIKGLQFGLGVLMIQTGAKFVLSHPAGLGAMTLGGHIARQGGDSSLMPTLAQFKYALVALVLPQLPLTLGNAVLATRDCAEKYFGKAASRVTSTHLATTIGLGNLAAGFLGGVPMCHGAGGMTAHYRFGARTGAAPALLGVALLVAGIAGGHAATSLLGALPASILGIMLIYVGIRHAGLAIDAFRNLSTALAVLSMGVVTYYTKNLLIAVGVGFVVKCIADLARPMRQA